MRVDPEHPAGAVHGRQTAERSERDRVISAEDERKRPSGRRLGHPPRDQLARVVDLWQEPRAFVAQGRRLRDGRLDVAFVSHVVPESDETLLEPRVPDRRRPHVDAAPALPEIERRTDDRDLALRAHGRNLPRDAATLSRLGEVAQLVEHTAENRGVAGSSPALATFE